MTICPECYGVGVAVISCGFCGAHLCEQCYMRHLAAYGACLWEEFYMCHLAAYGPDDEKQKPGKTTKAS